MLVVSVALWCFRSARGGRSDVVDVVPALVGTVSLKGAGPLSGWEVVAPSDTGGPILLAEFGLRRSITDEVGRFSLGEADSVVMVREDSEGPWVYRSVPSGSRHLDVVVSQGERVGVVASIKVFLGGQEVAAERFEAVVVIGGAEGGGVGLGAVTEGENCWVRVPSGSEGYVVVYPSDEANAWAPCIVGPIEFEGASGDVVCEVDRCATLDIVSKDNVARSVIVDSPPRGPQLTVRLSNIERFYRKRAMVEPGRHASIRIPAGRVRVYADTEAPSAGAVKEVEVGGHLTIELLPNGTFSWAPR